ncbi:MAG TPA: hypothetical protein VF163_11930 [Micromonosporaceae bacterium]
MPEKKRGRVISAVGAGLAGLGLWVSHTLGMWGDDVARGVKPLVDDAGRVVVVEGDEIVKQAATTFREMRNGTENERIVIRAACASMQANYSHNSTQQQFSNQIYADLGPSYGPGTVGHTAVSSIVSRAATAMAVAEQNGGLAANYLRFCVT